MSQYTSWRMSEYVVYMFSKEGCPPCAEVKPYITEMQEELYAEYTWKYLDIDSTEAKTFGVAKVPTMVLTRNGVQLGSHSGSGKLGYFTLLRKSV